MILDLTYEQAEVVVRCVRACRPVLTQPDQALVTSVLVELEVEQIMELLS